MYEWLLYKMQPKVWRVINVAISQSDEHPPTFLEHLKEHRNHILSHKLCTESQTVTLSAIWSFQTYFRIINCGASQYYTDLGL